MKIEQEHWDNAVKIKDLTHGILAGSVHVNIDEANDIDIVVSYDQWERCQRDYNLKEFNLVQSATESDGTYQVALYELMAVWSCGKVNILVYNPDFIPAIKAAIRDMKRNPELFGTRDARIKLHQYYKQLIRDMLDPTQGPMDSQEL